MKIEYQYKAGRYVLTKKNYEQISIYLTKEQSKAIFELYTQLGFIDISYESL